MKTLIFTSILFLFSFTNVFANDVCKCNLVQGKTALSGKYFPDRGETVHTVPQGSELWVTMSPAASWNRGENGGCRLQPGEQYVANGNGIPIRAVKCGNAITQYQWHTSQGTATTYTYSSGNSEVTYSLKRIEDNQAVLNDNINATYQQAEAANQKADYIIQQNNDILHQVKKARTEAWVQTGIGVAGQVATVLILNKKRPHNYTTTNTTSYYYVGGNTGGRPNNNGGGLWGGNTNH